MRHLMKYHCMVISGTNSLEGELGELIKDEVHLYEVNDKFEVWKFGNGLRDLPDDIVTDLSTDQKYMYKIVKMVITGVLNKDVLKQVIGPVNHSLQTVQT